MGDWRRRLPDAMTPGAPALTTVGATAVLLVFAPVVAGPQTARPGGLAIESGNGVRPAAPGVGRYDFGAVRVLTRAVVDQPFVLDNAGPSAITGLTAEFAPDAVLRVFAGASTKRERRPIRPGGALPGVPGGGSIVVWLRIEMSAAPPGDVDYAVTVHAPARRTPLRLEVRGTVLPCVHFFPAVLSFGRIDAGRTRTLKLTARVDPRLAPSGSSPVLYCADPRIQIVPAPLDCAYVSHSLLLTPAQRAAGVFSYTVALSGDSGGPVRGEIAIAAMKPGPGQPAVQQAPAADPAARAALSSGSATVVGEVAIGISASPSEVDFGPVPAGAGATGAVTLGPAPGASLTGLRIDSGSRWICARLICITGIPFGVRAKAARATARLEALLVPGAPPGPLRTTLTLSLPDGQRLMLPLSGFARSAVCDLPRWSPYRRLGARQLAHA